MPLTISVAPSQEQALCEPEPIGFTFLPGKVRLGTQKFGVTVQMYILPRICCFKPECCPTSWKGVNYIKHEYHAQYFDHQCCGKCDDKGISVLGRKLYS